MTEVEVPWPNTVSDHWFSFFALFYLGCCATKFTRAIGSYETWCSYATVLKTHQSYRHPRPCSKLGKPFSWFLGGDWWWGCKSRLLLNQFGTGSQLVCSGALAICNCKTTARPFHRPAFDHLQYCNQNWTLVGYEATVHAYLRAVGRWRAKTRLYISAHTISQRDIVACFAPSPSLV